MTTWLDLDCSDSDSVVSSIDENLNDLYQGINLNGSKSVTTLSSTSTNRFKRPTNTKSNVQLPQSAKKSNNINHNHNNNNNNNVNNGNKRIKHFESSSAPLSKYANKSESFCLFLGNLPAQAKASDIVGYLQPFKIEPKDIRFDRAHTTGSYRCCYVDFYNEEDMQFALQSISSTEAPLFMGRVVEIEISEDNEIRPSSSSAHDPSYQQQHHHQQGHIPVVSKQDVRSFENKQSTKNQKQSSSHSPMEQSAPMQTTQSTNMNLSNDRFQSNVRGRGRGRDRGRRGRRNDYFAHSQQQQQQFGRYKQKNEKHRSSFSNPSFSDNLPQHKPVKILKRPKEANAVPVPAQKPNHKMNGAHHKKSHSLPSTPKIMNKSRFPTLAEDKIRINPMVSEYVNGTSNGHKNDNLKSSKHKSQYSAHNNVNDKHYHNEPDSYYYAKSKRHNGNAPNQQYHQHGSYKQKRHRNNHRKDQQQQQQQGGGQGDDYYSSKPNYKNKSYHDDRSNGSRYKGSNKSYRGRGRGRGRGKYSKKRHNNYNSYQ